MDFLFGSKPTPKELARDSDRALRKAGRDIDRESRELEREEKKLENEIKLMAKQNNKEGCAILAKQLLRIRKQKARTISAKGKVQSVGLHNKSMVANVKLADAMGQTAKTMQSINKIMKPEKVAADMKSFGEASMKMDMTDEMINDTLDDILGDSDEEQEADSIVNQVLDEIGIELSGKIAQAPAAGRHKLNEASKSSLPTDEEIEAQLAQLKT